MTQDEIIEMARQAGMDYMQYITEDNMKKVETFAKLVAAKEREACAKVAICYDSEPWKHTPAYSHVADMVSVEIGKAIRTRGEA